MKNDNSILDTIDKRYSHKKVYQKNDLYFPDKKKFAIKDNAHDIVKVKVEEMCREISGKYDVKESELYDKLYLKVRKLFLELM